MAEITQLRKKVDAIDQQILEALCIRVKVCKSIGDLKKKHGKPIRDISRENEVFVRIKQKCSDLNLDPLQVEAVYREIVNMCSDVQK